MILIDGHLDLAWSALAFGRDLHLPLATLRAQEGHRMRADRATVTLPALREGGVVLALASLFALPRSHATPGLPQGELAYDDRLPQKQRQMAAHRVAMRQLDWYHRLADSQSGVILVQEWKSADSVLSPTGPTPPIGLVLHMEGGDPIRESAEVALWYERGVRSIGLAWHSTVWAPGSAEPAARLPRATRPLLERMESLSMLLDLAHMGDAAAHDCLEAYTGPIAISHTAARARVPLDRLTDDTTARLLAERDGVIGIALYNRFLRRDHAKGMAKHLVTLADVVAHIDHFCQLLGSANYVALGSDFDGGFGANDIPAGFDSAADWPLLAQALREYGYDSADIAAIFHTNWQRLLRRVL